MTVVIALKFKEKDGSEGVFMTADKMVSFGDIGIEYEVSKLEKIADKENFRVISGCAGQLSLIDEFNQRLKTELNSNGSHDPFNVGVEIYNRMLSERIERMILSPWGLKLDDLKKENIIHANLLFDIMGKTKDLIIDFYRNLEVILAGNCDGVLRIVSLTNGDLNEGTKLGFSVSGSGSQSAWWTLIHRGYRPNLDRNSCIVLGLFAKIQAEESMGVGSNTDAQFIRGQKITNLKEDWISNIREEYKQDLSMQKAQITEIVKRL